MGILLFLGSCARHPSGDQSVVSGVTVPPAINSPTDLAGVIARLEEPDARMEAFRELLTFADPLGYVSTLDYVSDGDFNAVLLRHEAYEAARNAPELEATVVAM